MTDEIRNGPPKGAVKPEDEPPAGYAQVSARPSPLQVPARKRRVAVYVDGFNLYYGMHEKFQRRYLWLDLMALASRLLKPDQELRTVKFFTARMRNDPDAAARQAQYLGALRATGVEVVAGRFQEKDAECLSCGATWKTYEEKESDVNFCVQLLHDALNNDFDVALLVTGDSDMSPAVRLVRQQRPGIRLISVFPPLRASEELRRATHAALQLGPTPLRQSQLPERVVHGERSYTRPFHWR